jgi:hypothetical protein
MEQLLKVRSGAVAGVRRSQRAVRVVALSQRRAPGAHSSKATSLTHTRRAGPLLHPRHRRPPRGPLVARPPVRARRHRTAAPRVALHAGGARAATSAPDSPPVGGLTTRGRRGSDARSRGLRDAGSLAESPGPPAPRCRAARVPPATRNRPRAHRGRVAAPRFGNRQGSAPTPTATPVTMPTTTSRSCVLDASATMLAPSPRGCRRVHAVRIAALPPAADHARRLRRIGARPFHAGLAQVRFDLGAGRLAPQLRDESLVLLVSSHQPG